MKKKLFITILLLWVVHRGGAQPGKLPSGVPKAKYVEFYIAQLDNRPPIATKNLFFDPKTIAKLSTISDTANTEVSKLLNVSFVLIVKFSSGTELLTLNEVLKFYKIPAKDWTLPVAVDDQQIDYPGTILIAKNQIRKVTIERNVSGNYIKITLI